MQIYKNIIERKKNNEKLLAILIDPDKISLKEIKTIVKKIEQAGADFISVGGSFLSKNYFNKLIKKLKKHTRIPVIIFPGSTMQISPKADAILFLSLISGRNPEYLIGKHIEAAPIIKSIQIETIPTAYILIENPYTTTVEYITQTRPIPRKKIDLAVATAMAGELLGLKLIYLEAGSGAQKHIPLKMIKKVSSQTNLPVIVGGGVKSKNEVSQIWNAGADLVVVGTAFEEGDYF